MASRKALILTAGSRNEWRISRSYFGLIYAAHELAGKRGCFTDIFASATVMNNNCRGCDKWVNQVPVKYKWGWKVDPLLEDWHAPGTKMSMDDYTFIEKLVEIGVKAQGRGTEVICVAYPLDGSVGTHKFAEFAEREDLRVLHIPMNVGEEWCV